MQLLIIIVFTTLLFVDFSKILLLCFVCLHEGDIVFITPSELMCQMLTLTKPSVEQVLSSLFFLFTSRISQSIIYTFSLLRMRRLGLGTQPRYHVLCCVMDSHILHTGAPNSISYDIVEFILCVILVYFSSYLKLFTFINLH